MSWPTAMEWIVGVGAAVALVIRYATVRKRRNRFRDGANAALRRAFANSDRRPTLTCSASHLGDVVLTLVFTSAAERLNAEQSGEIDAFKRSVQELCRSVRPKKVRFDPESGIYITTESEQAELLARARQLKEQFKKPHGPRDA